MEKDALMEAYYVHGRFPADRGAHKTREGKILRGAGHIETEIKSNYWYEFLQIFAPVGLFALVLYLFYNALPSTYTKSLNKESVMNKAGQLQRTPINFQKQKLLTSPASNISKDQDSLLAKGMTIYTDVSKNPAVRKVVQLPELSSKGLRDEMIRHQPAVDTIFTQKNALQDMRTKLPSNRVPVQNSKTPSKMKGQTVLKSANQPPKPSSSVAQGKNTSLKEAQPKASAPKVGQSTKLASPAPKLAPGKSNAAKSLNANAAPQKSSAKKLNGPLTTAQKTPKLAVSRAASNTKTPGK